MKYIINPIDGKKILLNSQKGVRILKNYINTYKNGAAQNSIIIPYKFIEITINILAKVPRKKTTLNKEKSSPIFFTTYFTKASFIAKKNEARIIKKIPVK